MIKLPNTKGLTHERVKEVLTKSVLDCVESKPGFFELRKKVYFIIKKNSIKIELTVTPLELKYYRMPSGVFYWGPIAAYALLNAVFKMGAIVLVVFYGIAWLIDRSTNDGDFKTVVTDINDEIIKGSENEVESMN